MGTGGTANGQEGIGARVRAARERLGWSRETLAFRSGVSWSAIAQAEIGRRTNLRPRTLLSLANALGVTIDYLVAGSRIATPMLTHCALLYKTDGEFLDAAAPFLTVGVERQEAVLAVTTQANIDLLRKRLGRAVRKVELAERAEWYRTPAAALDGYRAFLEERVAEGAPWVRILGEPPWNHGGKLQERTSTCYEATLNLAFAAEPASVMCAYDGRTVSAKIMRGARATHPQLAEHGGLASSSDYGDPVKLVLEL
jgi:transcriptional regulator with XRE-family HTH domain